jgi:hypothetical protein
MAAGGQKALDRVRGQIPVERLGRPEGPPDGSLPAADESGFITGQIWAVNGGLDR